MQCFQQRRYLMIFQAHLRGGFSVLNTDTGRFEAAGGKGRLPVLAPFFPARETCHPEFFRFSCYSFLAAVCSSIGGVLSTQSLLIAASHISPSVSTGIGLAATINWVLKDGLGQIGGILFAAKYGNKLDSDPRFFRYYSMVSLQIASLMELVTGLLPPVLFLPLASLANVAKSISWMGMSATRTKAMDQFQIGRNIAELTSKHWSQIVAASVVGMAGGIGLSSLGAFLGCSPAWFNICVFPLFGMAAIRLNHASCYSMEMSNLTVSRLKDIMAHVIRNNLDDFINKRTVALLGAVPSAQDIIMKEDFRWLPADPFPDVLINPVMTERLSARILKTIKRLGTSFEKHVFVACLDGKYHVWSWSEAPSLSIPVIALACYCSAIVRGMDWAGKSELEQSDVMLELLEKTNNQYKDLIVLMVERFLEVWDVNEDFIPATHAIHYLQAHEQ